MSDIIEDEYKIVCGQIKDTLSSVFNDETHMVEVTKEDVVIYIHLSSALSQKGISSINRNFILKLNELLGLGLFNDTILMIKGTMSLSFSTPAKNDSKSVSDFFKKSAFLKRYYDSEYVQ